VLYSTMILTGTGFSSQILGFLYRICLSRLIGAENMGLFQLLMPVYSVLLSISAVGLTVAVSRLSAEYYALENPKAAGQLMRQCVVLFLTLFGTLAAITIFLYDPISVFLLGDARTQTGLLLLLPCILLTGIENLHKYFFYGIGDVRPPALVELAEQVIRMGAVILLLLLFLPQSSENTVALIVLGMILCEIFSTFTLVSLYRRRRRGAGGAGEPVPAPLLRRKVAAVAVPIGLTSLLGNLMGSVNAVMIPQRLVRAGMEVSEAMSAFGVLFGMALPMAVLPTAFIGAFSIILIPKLTESLTLGRTKEIQSMVSRTLLGTAALAMPAMTFLFILGPAVGDFLFHHPAVGDYLPVLAPGVLINCFRAILGSMLNGLGRENISAASGLVSELFHLAFTWVGTGMPGVGLYGFLYGYCFSGLLGSVWNGIALCKETGMRPRFPMWLLSPGLAALFSGLCTNFLFRAALRGGLSGIVSALVSLLPGVLFYCVALSAQGVSLRRLLRMRE